MSVRASTSAPYVNTKKYCVMVHTYEDLESLYSELETLDSTPEGLELTREIECLERKPISRATVYRLTDWEATQLKQILELNQ